MGYIQTCIAFKNIDQHKTLEQSVRTTVISGIQYIDL